ncbi:MAG: lysylphosphatidylglycerol synthase transmembrane domain-containing protein [Dehalococcoidia bacterium]
MRRFLVGMLFTAASLVLLERLIDWRTAFSVLQGADITFIALAVSCLIFSLAAKSVRWRLLLPSDSTVTTPRLFRIMHISFMLNNVLPARLGDVARVAMTSMQPDLRVGHVLSSMLTERVVDSVTLLTCFVLVSPFLPIPGQYVSWLETAWIALAAIATVVLAAVILHKWLGRIVSHVPLPRAVQGNTRLEEEARSFRDGWRQLFSRRRVTQIWVSSAVAWLGAFAINYLLMRALAIEVPITVAVLLTCTTNLAMLIPSSPGYIGVFHAAATLSLIPFEVGEARALSFAILAHLVNVLPVSILGAIFLLIGRESLSFNLQAIRKRPPGQSQAS